MKRPATAAPTAEPAKKPATAKESKPLKAYKYKYKDNGVWGFKLNNGSGEIFRVGAPVILAAYK